MLKQFKQFLLRGNVVDLAVAVVVGAAFTAVIAAFVKDLVTPLIGAIFRQPDFSSLTFTVNHSQFNYGSFLNALISFVLVAAVVFFAVVIPLTRVLHRLNLLPAETPAPVTKSCPECISDIPAEARRCAFCTSELAPGTAA
ncbi:MAG: large conductance mechanosensitive channel protein MscL [Acidimicrobiales bacterium]